MQDISYDTLVNKEHPLDKDYVPSNMVLYEDETSFKIDPNEKIYVDKLVFEKFNELRRDALENNYIFYIDSGYRSYNYQKVILDYYTKEFGSLEEALKTVAMPGTSEHQTGLAIDVCLRVNGEVTDKFDDSFNEIKWLHENCYKYGFILRYPKGKETITGYDYECWHIRYVGLDLSTYMHDNDIKTLEEYYMMKK